MIIFINMAILCDVMTKKIKMILILMAIFAFDGISIESAFGSSDDTAIADMAAKLIILDQLDKAGIKDVNLNIVDGRPNGGEKSVIMSYSSTSFTTEDSQIETAKILGAFLGMLQTKWDCDSLSVIVGDITGTVTIATWYCEKEWARDYSQGKMTSEEILTNVLGTVEPWI